MKKFTFLFVAAVMAVSANAQLGFSEGSAATGGTGNPVGEVGNYDLETGTWIAEEPAVNQMFIFAIKVTNAQVLSWLAETPGNTLALQDVRSAISETVNKHSFRLERQGTSNVYAIAIVFKQLMPDINFSTLNNDNKYIHFQIGQGGVDGNGTWEYNVYGYGNLAVAIAAGADAPAMPGGYEGLEGEYAVPGIARPSELPAGLEDIFADTENIEYFEFYNLQGLKLNVTDADQIEGMFIAVPFLKNGTRGVAKTMLNVR
ncbi:MAG: hypothetical protein LBN95_11895 [Prevotellaceae bacterium]|jgi:hypothetical protein|nr:hypothetical protein [Prevotellaceae bacterium]